MHATNRAPSVTAIAVTDAPDRRPAAANGSHHQQVVEIQRARMLTAAIQTACEHGGWNVTVAHVVGRAGVSRRTFYEIFGDSEECLLAAFQETVDRIAERVVAAYESQDRWREKMRSSLATLLTIFDEEPHLARFTVVETLAAGTRALHARQKVLAEIMAAVHDGGLQTTKGQRPTPLVAESVVGAVFSVIHNRILQAQQKPLIQLLNPLMSTIVLPYLGPAAARGEMGRAVERIPSRPSKPPLNPFKDLEIRMTYRTMRALAAVAAHPKSSNRVVGEAAGITDQGQVSKLLARLQRLGLVKNDGGSAHRGEPNAWSLTPAGEEMHNAIAA